VTLDRQTRPRTARVKRQRKNSNTNSKLAKTANSDGALPKIIVVELPNANIPKTVNHPSIVFTPLAANADLCLFCSLFVRLWKFQTLKAPANCSYLRQLECQPKA